MESIEPNQSTPCDEIKIPLCEPCRKSKNYFKATKYCKDCEEYLCEECTCNHQKQTMTMVHDTTDAIEKLEGDIYCGPSKERTPKNTAQMFCSACDEYRGIKEKASAFCLDCDRKLLCSKCTESHKVRRKTQAHNVVMDLEKLEVDRENEEEELSVQLEQTLYCRAQASPIEKDEYTRPGKPVLIEAGSDFIVLSWDPPANFQDGNYYQVSMKDVDQHSKWKFYNKEFTTASGKLENIKSNAKFVFRVRVVHKHGEGLYSPESDLIITFPSPASRIVDFSTKVDGENPTTYAVTENRTARDETVKSRQFLLGSPPLVATKEKNDNAFWSIGNWKKHYG